MKLQKFPLFLLILIIVALTACQAKSPINNEEACSIDAETGEYDPSCAPDILDSAFGPEGYPAEEGAYPLEVEYLPISNDAYPITEDDLTLLLTGWHLENYVEDDVEINTLLKVLSFYPDGTYTLATETELTSGTWSAFLLASESALFLTSKTGEKINYEIINLEAEKLTLRTWRGSIQIDENYLLDDESCGCD